MLVGTQVGRVYYLDPLNKNQKLKYGEPEYNNNIIALYSESKQKFSCVSHNGKVLIQDIENIFDQEEINLNDKIQAACFKQRDELFYSNDEQKVFYRDTKNEKSQSLLNLNTKKVNEITYEENKLGLSCKDLNFQIYDMSKNQIIWKAKNFKRDDLNLKAPVDNQQSYYQNNCYYVLSAFDKVHVYDIRAQRKQIQEINCQLGEDYYTNRFALYNNNQQFAVSNIIGHINLLDFRKPKIVQKRFKEHYGCVTDVKIQDNLLITSQLKRQFGQTFKYNRLE